MAGFNWFWKAMGDTSGRNQRRSKKLVDQAGQASKQVETLTDAELAAAARALIKDNKLSDTATFLAILAVAAERTLKMRPFPVQAQATLRLLEGDIVHMATGEGKTLVGAMAATGFALQGKRVHCVTVNDYLARRDAAWMKPLVEFFGLQVANVTEKSTPKERRAAYSADVVYAPINEIGFDVLRDRQETSLAAQVMAPMDVAIVDEADSVLVDEALVPLVLAGSQPGTAPRGRIVDIVRTLELGDDYTIDDDRRNVFLTEDGAAKVEQALGISSLYSAEMASTLVQVNLALHAQALLLRDVHYIVRDGKVALIDASRGRVADLQRWPDGLQAAVEAKEGLAVTEGGRILDTITLQALARKYPLVCGMTGTAVEAVDQLRQFYDLRVSVIDRNHPLQRFDEADRIYATVKEKNAAIVQEILARHEQGQPVLVGTHDVAESEELAAALAEYEVNCAVLNAKNDDEEAAIIADAGRPGAITVSTQMAGRGTDIRLGGSDEAERDAAVAAGGLCVIGTSRHKTARLDNQLRGRAGRQGDPGYSVFFVSLEDAVVQATGETVNATPEPDGRIASTRIANFVDHCQRVCEGQLLEIHAQTWKYNKLITDQRDIIDGRRKTLLETPKAWEELQQAASGRAKALQAAGIDSKVLEQAAREIMLFHLDHNWSDHLAMLDDVRESIHLRAIAKETPLDEFHRIAVAEFKQLAQRAFDEAIATFKRVEIDHEGAHLEDLGLNRPSATWTYMVSDNPLQGSGNRIINALTAAFR